jgi:4-hydroxybenzoate polyprenyltransferase
LTATRLGVAMVALQASIGIVNDLVDVPRDMGRVPPKPIPAGLVSVRAARVGAVAAAAVGIAGAAGSGIGLALLALVVLAIGYGYDFAAKGTAWSWVPFAIGIPILPVFGWVGPGTGLAGWFGVLIPAAMFAGAALAIANARADLEADRAAGTESVATVLGPVRSWYLATACFAVVVVAAFWTALDPDAPTPVASTSLLVLVAGALALGVGAVVGRRGSPNRRERAWELQAIAIAVLALGWLSVVTTARPG